jgi:hypothetical protein
MSQTQSLYRQQCEIMQNFDFKKVLKCMKALKWKYYDGEPDIERLQSIAEGLISDVTRVVESGSQQHWLTCSTGGFKASAQLVNGDWLLTLEFIVARWEGLAE